MQTADMHPESTVTEPELREAYEAQLHATAEEINRLVLRQLELLEEVEALKENLKTAREKLAEARAENKKLAQYDPLRMKKNLDAGKQKLARKQQDCERMQRALSRSAKVNVQLMQRVSRLTTALRRLEAAGGTGGRCTNRPPTTATTRPGKTGRG
jgi:uncharacterized coiled-coil DUF342 family protein